MLRKIVFSISTILWVLNQVVADPQIEVKSPNEQIAVTVAQDNSGIAYSIQAMGKMVVGPSQLGLLFEGEEDLRPVQIIETEARTADETWRPVYGKRFKIRNHYNEVKLNVGSENQPDRDLMIEIRVYDEGVAIRYIVGAGDESLRRRVVSEDATTINFTNRKAEAWSYIHENRPIGPEILDEIHGLRSYPLVVKYSDQLWLTVTEAALHDFDYFDLNFMHEDSQTRLHIDPSEVETPFNTPWRAILISETPRTFQNSDLLVNLSPEPTGDFSWVKPGISLWDWRAWGFVAPDGFTYGLEIESWKRFIDFAAEHGIPYLLLDANWYGAEHSTLSNPFEGGKAAQVKQALDYGREKGVGLILYLNDKASVNFSIEEIAKAYSEWGAVGIKYGFMEGGGQEKVRKTERVVKACAENKLLVDFHDGPIPPTGHERTWPNWITREYIHAQSDAKRTHSPGDFMYMAYVNTIAGPLDANHGMFDYENTVAQRPRMFMEVYSTIVAEAARTLIIYSGLTVIPDAPESYAKHPELLRFITAQKQPWLQSSVLAGEFGKWITTMRQAQGEAYLVGSATDESARRIEIVLNFLDPDKNYRANILSDAENAHYKTNRSAYTYEQREVKAGDVVEARLAPGGGHCMLIEELQ